MIALINPTIFPVETPNPLEVPAAFGESQWQLDQGILTTPEIFLTTDWGWEDV